MFRVAFALPSLALVSFLAAWSSAPNPAASQFMNRMPGAGLGDRPPGGPSGREHRPRAQLAPLARVPGLEIGGGIRRPPRPEPGSDRSETGGKRPGREPGGRRPPVIVTLPDPERPRLVCEGGHVSRGQCVCDRGEARRKTGPAQYVCDRIVVDEPRRPPKIVVVPVPPRVATVVCEGGRVRRGVCVCPRGETRHATGENAFACLDRTAKRPPTVATGAARPLPPAPPLRPAQPRLQPALPDDDEFVADEVLVSLAAATPETVEEDVARRLGIALLERLPLSLIDARIVRYRIPDRRAVSAVVAQLRDEPGVRDPQPNFIYRHQGGAAGAPLRDLQYALAKVEVPAAHDLANGRGALVAVIDSGIDSGHPDLEESVAEAFDATGAAAGEPDPHGTAIAGIIAARGLVRGVSPAARLLGVRAFTRSPGSKGARTTTFVLLRGLEWSVGHGARVFNLSFAGPRDPLVHESLKAARTRNAIIVAAAGNNGPDAPPAYPAAYEEVIAVTATDATDGLYAKANRGAYIALAAPGVDIFAPGLGRGHELQSGTSFAAAHVSGIIALMLERNPQLRPEEARRALTAAALDLGAPGRDEDFGAGRANAFSAVRLVEPRIGASN